MITNRKKGLGRGLSALFGDEKIREKQTESGTLNKLSISDLSRNPYQPRQNFSEAKLNELASSIKKINFYDVFKAQIKSITLSSQQKYNDRIEINKSLMNVLRKYRKVNNKENLLLVDKKQQFLEREFKALTRRNQLVENSFLVRKLNAIGLLLRGDYSYFNNLKSFVRDMLR